MLSSVCLARRMPSFIGQRGLHPQCPEGSAGSHPHYTEGLLTDAAEQAMVLLGLRSSAWNLSLLPLPPTHADYKQLDKALELLEVMHPKGIDRDIPLQVLPQRLRPGLPLAMSTYCAVTLRRDAEAVTPA